MRFFIFLIIFMVISTKVFALEHSDLTITLKDLKHSSKDDELEVNFELSLEPKNTDITDYNLDFEIDYDKSVDAYDKTTVKETEITFDWQYEHKKLFPYFSYTNSFEYTRKKEAHFYEKENDYKIGLIGIKCHIYNDNDISEFSLMYTPIYNYSSYGKMNYADNTFSQQIDRSILQRLKLTLNFSLLETKLNIGNEIKWDKISKLNKELASEGETNFNWDFTIDYQLTEHISIGMEYILDRDSQRKTQGMDETEYITNFRFSIHL